MVKIKASHKALQINHKRESEGVDAVSRQAIPYLFAIESFPQLHAFSGSAMPPLVITYVASRSGQSGESWILATRSSPRPLRNRIRVAEACAKTWPPTGLRPSAPANKALAPGSDCTWLV